MNLTKSEENCLKAIYSVAERNNSEHVSNGDLGERLQIKPSSVTDMVKRLADKELIGYAKYKGSTLTREGKQIAIRVIRKHRLWEVFLAEKLHFGWDEVHDLAEQLEHIQSHELTDRLEEFLGFPQVDPHGDPIPSKDGEILKDHTLKPLSNFQINFEGNIKGLNESDDKFLQYLKKMGLLLGVQLKVVERHEFDNSVMVEFENGNRINLSDKVAQNILVK